MSSGGYAFAVPAPRSQKDATRRTSPPTLNTNGRPFNSFGAPAPAIRTDTFGAPTGPAAITNGASTKSFSKTVKGAGFQATIANALRTSNRKSTPSQGPQNGVKSHSQRLGKGKQPAVMRKSNGINSMEQVTPVGNGALSTGTDGSFPTRGPTERTKQLSSFATNFANRLLDHLRSENIRAPEWSNEVGNPSKRGIAETMKENYKKFRTQAYGSLRKAEIIHDPKIPRSLKDALPFKGICEDMCPEFEQVSRIAEFDVMTEEKAAGRDNTLWAQPHLMVKKFGRSAAGQEEPLPMDVRSIDALRRTTDYLIDELLNCDDNLPSMHNYLWDRTRAIRRDFVFHSTKTDEEMKDLVYVFETITRFHAVALHLLSRKGFAKDNFDEQQELDQLGRTLLSLIEAYNECRKRGVTCENEAEFRAYWILRNYRDSAIISRIPEWGDEYWFQSNQVQTAVCLVQAMTDLRETVGPFRQGQARTMAGANFQAYFAIVEDPETSYTMACIAETHFIYVRERILKNFVRGYARYRDAPRYITAKEVQQVLRFDTVEQSNDFIEQHGFEFTEWVPEGKKPVTEPYLLLDNKRKHVPTPRMKQIFSQQLVERKRGCHSLSHVIHNTVYEGANPEDKGALETSSDEENWLFVKQSSSPPKKKVDAAPSALTNGTPTPGFAKALLTSAGPSNLDGPCCNPTVVAHKNPFGAPTQGPPAPATASTSASLFSQAAQPSSARRFFFAQTEQASLSKLQESAGQASHNPFGEPPSTTASSLFGKPAQAPSSTNVFKSNPFANPAVSQTTIQGSSFQSAIKSSSNTQNQAITVFGTLDGTNDEMPSLFGSAAPGPVESKTQLSVFGESALVTAGKSEQSFATGSSTAATSIKAAPPSAFGGFAVSAGKMQVAPSLFSSSVLEAAKDQQPSILRKPASAVSQSPDRSAASSIFGQELHGTLEAPFAATPAVFPASVPSFPSATQPQPTSTATTQTRFTSAANSGASITSLPSMSSSGTSAPSRNGSPSQSAGTPLVESDPASGKPKVRFDLSTTSNAPARIQLAYLGSEVASSSAPALEPAGPSAPKSILKISQSALAPMQSAVVPAQPAATSSSASNQSDLLSNFNRWVVLGDDGIIDHFTDAMVTFITAQVFEQHQREEEVRRRRKEDEQSWREARKFQVYNLSVKYFYRWRKNVRALTTKRILREGKRAMREYYKEKPLREKQQRETAARAAQAAEQRARLAEAQAARDAEIAAKKKAKADLRKMEKLAQAEMERRRTVGADLLASGIFSGVHNEHKSIRQVVGITASGSDGFDKPYSPPSSRPSSSRSGVPWQASTVGPPERGGWKTRSLREKLGSGSLRRSWSASPSVNGDSNFGSLSPGRLDNVSCKRAVQEGFNGVHTMKRLASSTSKTPYRSRYWDLRAQGFTLAPDGTWVSEAIAALDGASSARSNPPGSPAPAFHENGKLRDRRASTPASIHEQHHANQSSRWLKLPNGTANARSAETSPASTSARVDKYSPKRKRDSDDEDDDASTQSSKRRCSISKQDTEAMVEDTQKMLRELRETMDRIDQEERPWMKEQMILLKKEASVCGSLRP